MLRSQNLRLRKKKSLVFVCRAKSLLTLPLAPVSTSSNIVMSSLVEFHTYQHASTAKCWTRHFANLIFKSYCRINLLGIKVPHCSYGTFSKGFRGRMNSLDVTVTSKRFPFSRREIGSLPVSSDELSSRWCW